MKRFFWDRAEGFPHPPTYLVWDRLRGSPNEHDENVHSRSVSVCYSADDAQRVTDALNASEPVAAPARPDLFE